MDASCTVDLSDPNYSWEEDRKYILRGWALVFSTLTTLMVLSAVDGRMAYLEGSYSGYMGFWINCKKYKCSNVGQVTVLIHMSMGLMMLALTICLILVTTMALSFWPVFRRLNKTDLIFSLLSFGIGVLSYLNYAGMWSQASFSWDRRVSYWRWASRLTSMRHLSRQSDSDRKSSSLPGQGIPAKPP
ncbi:uncharacterized protein LOC132216603 isoform X2 [Myotis daubentonii]|uniref:uncharacterized protein LOC132216603 isoform X2 n=1 Tax=Myotis daubentonii TaxID=98922 RepID=UPI0028734409|nr:uncharacterized protein LOC132216603 isoform X2 [Myotis daubentonii]